MQRNEETLSTRDLASTNDLRADTVSATENDVESAGSAPTQVDDQMGTPPVAESSEVQETRAESTTDNRVPEADRGVAAESRAPETDAAPEPDGVPASSAGADTSSGEPLLTPELGATFQRRWEEVQTRFVDEPRGAVEEADGLVANLMQELAAGFAKERERLEAQWGRGEDISTEDLRVALQRYRSFFQRLLST